MEDPGQEVPPELLRGEQAGGGAEGPRHRGRALWTQVGAVEYTHLTNRSQLCYAMECHF